MHKINVVTPNIAEKAFVPADFPRGQIGIIVNWAMHKQYVGCAVLRVNMQGHLEKDALVLLDDGTAWTEIAYGAINDGSCRIRLLRPGEKIEITGY